jgi:hypothetical protein
MKNRYEKIDLPTFAKARRGLNLKYEPVSSAN